ncbi:MAG: tetratricopeptide repeat protein [Candidatus Melainabacteria bacterium]|nr:tetratricopeptide repeat protein [Candidatus Melainabacteria bacterium]
MKKLILVVGIALTMPLSANAQTAAAKALVNRYLEMGRVESNGKNLDAAEAAYRRASELDPANPMSHYLLANILARTGRHEEAIVEYKISLSSGPRSSVSKYCRQALSAYKHTAFNETANSREFVPPPPPTSLETAFDAIDRQAQCKKKRTDHFATNLSKTAVKGGDWKARDLKLSAESEVANMYASTRVILPRNSRRTTGATNHLEAEAARIRAEADERARLEQALANERAADHAAWSKERQNDIDDVALNLKDQLTDQPSKFGFDLAPTGTGLYVRNYKTSKPKKQLPDPRFSVLRLIEPGVQETDSGLK